MNPTKASSRSLRTGLLAFVGGCAVLAIFGVLAWYHYAILAGVLAAIVTVGVALWSYAPPRSHPVEPERTPKETTPSSPPGPKKEPSQDSQLLRILMDSVPENIYFKDRNSRFIRVSKALAKRLNLSNPDQAVGKTDFDFFTPEHSMPAFADEQEIIRTGRPIVSKEEHETWRDGRQQWVRTTKLPLYDASGSLIGTYGLSSDITEAKRLEQELRGSEQRFRCLVENTADAFFVLDPDGRIVDVDQRACETLGYTRPEMLAKTLADIDAGEKLALPAVVPLGKSITRETSYRHKDGTLFPVEVRIAQMGEGLPLKLALVRNCAQRKQAEEALARTEAFYHSLVENLPQNLVRKDREGRITFANRRACALSGMDLDQLIGKTDHELYPADLADKYRQDDRRVAETGQPLELVEEHLAPQRDRLYMQVIKTPIADAQGQVIGTQVMFWDVTQQRRSEQRRATQHAVTRSLAECDTVGDAAKRILESVCKNHSWDIGVIRILQPDWQILSCEQLWCNPGIPLPKLEEQLRETVLPSSPGLASRVWKTREPVWVGELLNPPPLPQSALCVPILLGSEFLGVLEFFSRLKQPDDAELVQVLAGIGNQIGQFIERKKSEEAGARLVAILEATPDYVGIASPLGQLLYLNRAGRRLVGIGDDELIELLSDRDSYPVWARRILEQEGLPAAARKGVWRGETALLSRSGKEIPVSQVIVAHKSASGEVEFYSTITRDISERKQAEADLQKAILAADAASQAKSEFLANMSHEIRTPMNGIIGMTELALGTELAPEQRQYLKIVKSSADSLLRVLNDILDFSKIEAGKLDLDAAPFNLRDTVGDALQTLAVRASEKNLELSYEVLPDVHDRLVGDALRLRQVILNLVGNALKFTSQGEVVVRIELEEATEKQTCLRFSVRDTGPGIPPAKQQAIFEAFTQADTSTTRQFGGTGLGLAISSQLVGLMGGRIWVESELSKGSTFHFTARFVLGSDSGKRGTSRQLNLEGMPVLIVDDNDTNRGILRDILLIWRMKPTVVASGAVALEEMTRAARAGNPFPLLLLDAVMPEMDGFAIVERIKCMPELAGATIMMLSSRDRTADAGRCRELGVALYLQKPIKQSELLNAILTALGASPVRESPTRFRETVHTPVHPRKLRVLLAEDNEVNRELAVTLLCKREHSVEVTTNGKDAIDALGREKFDVVLMDVQMPELDGLAATVAIRQAEQGTGRHIPIIAMTAHAMKGDREKCLDAGMDAYVSKPLRPQELFQAIADVVRISGAPSPVVPEVPAVRSYPVLDKEMALTQVEGDLELLQKVHRMFRGQAAKVVNDIYQAIAASDSRALERASHKIKGSLGSFGACQAFETARRLEEMGRNGSVDGAAAMHRALEKEIEALHEAVEEMTRCHCSS
jgi:PAS domain S-box-containing protein